MRESLKSSSEFITLRAGARVGMWLRASLLLTAAFAAASHGTVSAQSAPALWNAMTSTVIVGPAIGPGRVRALNWTERTDIASTFPFGESFTGGVTLAAGGDIDGDDVPDVVVAMGPGGGFVRAHSGADGHTMISGFPYGPGFSGGVSVALGDVDGDRRADIIVGARQGAGMVRVFSGADFHPIASAPAPFGPGYAGGVHLAAGDVDGDGRAEVIAGQATGGLVSVLNSVDLSPVVSAFPFGAAFAGGVSVAAGDVDGDGLQDVVVAQAAGGAMLRVYSVVDRVALAAFAAVPFPLPGGLRVAAADLTGDGRAEIIGSAGPGGPPYVAIWDGNGLGLLDAFPVYEAGFAGGVAVAATGGKSVRFTSGDQAAFTVGAPGSFTITTAGAPTGVTIAATGTLPAGVTFTDHGNGTATLAGTPTGAGGEFPLTFTARHGVQIATQPFALRVLPVNEPPTFAVGPDQTLTEDAGEQTVPAWAANISAGPPYESGQTLTFAVTGNTNAALFFNPPTVSPDGTLSYTLAPNAHGTATITLLLQDNGGTANGGDDTSAPQSATITVTPVNDAPSFVAGVSHASAEDAGAQSIANWATAISAGPPDEAGQTLTFSVINNTNPTLFSVAPSVSPAGTLTYTAAPDANGTATVTLTLRDDGGTADGGVDTSAPVSVTISVTPVNDAPTFTGGGNQQSVEDAGPQSAASWASDITAGPSDEVGQTLTSVVMANTNPSLFSAAPAVSSAGTLTYTAAPNANGTASVTIAMRDDGGTADGGVDTSAPHTFTISVTDDLAVVLEKTLTTAPANLDMPESYRLRISVPMSSAVSLTSVGPVADTLPPGTVFNGATPAADCQPGCVGTTPATVTWTSACAVPLTPGANCDITLNVTFPSGTFPSGTNVTNSFAASGTPAGEGLQALGSAQVTHAVTTFVPAPAATLSLGLAPGSPNPPSLDEMFSYELNVGNSGNVPLDNMVVIDTLPVEMQVASVTTGVYTGLAGFAAGEGVRVSYEKNTALGVFTLWGSSPNVTTNTTLTAPPPGLGAGEYITRIRWEYGQAQPGMTPTSRPRVTGRIVNPDNTGGPVVPGDSIQNCADLTAVFTAGPTNLTTGDCETFTLGASLVQFMR
jgi:uncharacterized repeat protein (TIGR01451 family)